MANGSYIGKISALVTASTSDLSRKLRDGAKDVDRFSNSVRAQFDRASRSAENSLNQIFTPLQRLQRALTAGRSSTLNILTEDQVRRLQQSVSLAEQINKPLASAARAFQNLSADAAIAFAPALVRAQEAAIQLSNTLAETGQVGTTQFNQAQRAVERTAEAIQRLNSLQRASAAGLTGNEAQFVNPRALEEINAAAAASQRVGALPASQREDPGLRERVRQLAQFRQQIVETAAQVESLELSPDVDQTALESARRRLEQIIETTRRARVELESLPAATRGFTLGQATQSRRGLGLFSSQAGTDAEAALRRARELDAEYRKLPASAQAAVGGLAGIAARVADEVNQTQSGAENLISVLDRLQAKIRSTQESQSTALIVRPPDADVNIAATRGSLVENFERLQQDRANAARDALGPAIDAPSRSISSLEGRIVSLKGQLATLPEPLRSQFVPSVKSIEDAFVRLRVQGVNATEEDIQRLVTAVSEAERAGGRAFSNFGARGNAAQQFRTSFGGAGTAGLNLGIDRRQLQGVGAEIEFVQQRLAGLSDEVRGPVVNALQRYRTVVAQTFRSGAQNTEQGRRAIARARQEVVGLAADVLKVNPGRLGQQLKRVGDIGRGGFGNISLGIQQAAFAIDDFFSVTGGLDQRIRAAGNNISQLGFVLGGTTGLIVGIAASITSQLIAALIKWNSNGVETEDTVNALNDALARQKSLVEDLAQAYESIADAIGRSGFSSQTQELRNQSKAIDELRKKQEEQVRERVVASDPDVLREREFQASRERQLEESQSLEERVRLRRQIEASRRREEEATRAAVDTPGLAPSDVAFLVGRPGLRADAALAFPGATEAQLRDQEARGFPGSRFAADRQRQVQEERQALLDRLDAAGSDGERRQIALDAISQEERRIEQQILNSGLSEDDIVNQQRRQALEELEQQRQQLEKGFLQQVNEITTQSLTAALRASESIGQSIELISSSLNGGSSQVQAALEAVDQRILNAAEELEEAQKTGDVGRATAAQEEIDAAQRLAQEFGNTASSVASFAEALDRVSGQLLNTVVGEARSGEDRALRDANRARARVREDGQGERNVRRSIDADRDLRRRSRDRRRIEDLAENAERRNRELVADFEEQQRRQGGPDDLFTRFAIERRDAAQADINRLERERDEAIRRGDADAAQEAASGIREAEERRREAQREIDRRFEESEQGQEARRNAAEVDVELQRQLLQDERIRRGRELEVSPAERAGQQLAEDLRSLEAAFRDNPDRNQQEFEAARQRLIDERLRQQAPAIFGLSDQVANAVLSGPSRAALQATDVSTVEGNRELNRLIRGDDSARDQNLVELQRQSQKLDELIQAVKEEGVPIANE